MGPSGLLRLHALRADTLQWLPPRLAFGGDRPDHPWRRPLRPRWRGHSAPATTSCAAFAVVSGDGFVVCRLLVRLRVRFRRQGLDDIAAMPDILSRQALLRPKVRYFVCMRFCSGLVCSFCFCDSAHHDIRGNCPWIADTSVDKYKEALPSRFAMRVELRSYMA